MGFWGRPHSRRGWFTNSEFCFHCSSAPRRIKESTKLPESTKLRQTELTLPKPNRPALTLHAGAKLRYWSRVFYERRPLSLSLFPLNRGKTKKIPAIRPILPIPNCPQKTKSQLPDVERVLPTFTGLNDFYHIYRLYYKPVLLWNGTDFSLHEFIDFYLFYRFFMTAQPIDRLWPVLSFWPALLTGFDRVWPGLTGFDRLWPALLTCFDRLRIWPALTGFDRLTGVLVYHILLIKCVFYYLCWIFRSPAFDFSVDNIFSS